MIISTFFNPEGFSQTYFPKGGLLQPPWIVNTEGHINLIYYQCIGMDAIDAKICTNH